ncbi:MAG TPA: hypothetical protein HPP56_03135, partial [Nitrospirae bacterium]|nr:hypothetical protein [Nitrospirota bacterium]
MDSIISYFKASRLRLLMLLLLVATATLTACFGDSSSVSTNVVSLKFDELP